MFTVNVEARAAHATRGWRRIAKGRRDEMRAVCEVRNGPHAEEHIGAGVAAGGADLVGGGQEEVFAADRERRYLRGGARTLGHRRRQVRECRADEATVVREFRDFG